MRGKQPCPLGVTLGVYAGLEEAGAVPLWDPSTPCRHTYVNQDTGSQKVGEGRGGTEEDQVLD